MQAYFSTDYNTVVMPPLWTDEDIDYHIGRNWSDRHELYAVPQPKLMDAADRVNKATFHYLLLHHAEALRTGLLQPQPLDERFGNPALSAQALDLSNTVVFVGGLAKQTLLSDLREIFEIFGEVTYTKLSPNRSCAFVEYRHKADACLAIAKLPGFPLEGCPLRLNWGNPRGNATNIAGHDAFETQLIDDYHRIIPDERSSAPATPPTPEDRVWSDMTKSEALFILKVMAHFSAHPSGSMESWLRRRTGEGLGLPPPPSRSVPTVTSAPVRALHADASAFVPGAFRFQPQSHSPEPADIGTAPSTGSSGGVTSLPNMLTPRGSQDSLLENNISILSPGNSTFPQSESTYSGHSSFGLGICVQHHKGPHDCYLPSEHECGSGTIAPQNTGVGSFDTSQPATFLLTAGHFPAHRRYSLPEPTMPINNAPSILDEIVTLPVGRNHLITPVGWELSMGHHVADSFFTSGSGSGLFLR